MIPAPIPDRRVDGVAATGAALALLGCLVLPIAVFRANRIVSGVPHTLLAAGPAGWVLMLACLLALASAVAPVRGARTALELGCACGLVAALGFAVGQATLRLTDGAAPFSRVSIGSGAWLTAAGAAVVWFAALQRRPPRSWRVAAAGSTAIAWVAAGLWGGLARLSIVLEYDVQSGPFWQAAGTHLALVGASLAIALLVGIPLGVAASRWSRVRATVLGVVGVIQTVPSLALLGLLVVPLASIGLPGIGPLPGVIALTLYALLPIVRNTYIGLSGVDPAVVDAGRGMGMSPAQLLLRVEAPLALPLIVEGVRAATVMIVGIAAVVAFIGVGTLGVLLFLGWGQQADDLILLGAIPMVALAVAADGGLRWLGRAVTSPGLRAEG